MKKIICSNCNELFLPRRSDQRFCDRDCRNQFNNRKYKNRISLYKSLSDELRKQDEILEYMINENPVSLIRQEHLKKTGIYIERARQLVYKSDILIKVLFGKYQLILATKDYYKISKI